MSTSHVRWSFLLIYSVIALIPSLLFNLGGTGRWRDLRTALPAALRPWSFVPAALGPLVAAIVCYRVDRVTPRRMCFLGDDRLASILIAVIPLVAFTITGSVVKGVRGALVALAAACVAILYSLGEEAGWRGYLQDALVELRPSRKYLVVGVLWWAWHVRFTTIFDWTILLAIVVASAFVLGHVAEVTRSLLVVASMHSVIMLMTMNGSVDRARGLAGVFVILGWILVGKLRPTRRATGNSLEPGPR